MTAIADTQLQHWSQQIQDAVATSTTLEIRGGGSKHWYGQSRCGELLSTANYSGILKYEPSELVISAKAGTAVRELSQLLAQHGQKLAFEPPEFAGVATLGGMVASGLCGPGRYQSGPMRDFVLGVSLLDGRGDYLQFGGQVMKNVAGYDVSRSHVGALGSLGLLCSVSLKVLPKAAAELSLVLQMTEFDAHQQLRLWRQHWPVNASCWRLGRLYLRLAGYPETLQKARAALGGELMPGNQFWQDLREHQLDFFTQDSVCNLWRIALPLQCPGLDLPGKTLFEWGGQLQWLLSEASPAQVRAAAQAVGAYASLYRAQDKSTGVFQTPDAAHWRLQQALRQVFDPAGVFNRGRMFDESQMLEKQRG